MIYILLASFCAFVYAGINFSQVYVATRIADFSAPKTSDDVRRVTTLLKRLRARMFAGVFFFAAGAFLLIYLSYM